MLCLEPAWCLNMLNDVRLQPYPTAGAFYFVELCLGFHVGFVGKHNMAKKLIMDGKAVAWFYTVRGQFFVDAITAVAWVAQVSGFLHHLLFHPCKFQAAQAPSGC